MKEFIDQRPLSATRKADSEAKQFSSKYVWCVVLILNLANVSALVDRQVLTLMVEPLKRDFGLTDIQVSLLIGISFSLFYTILGIPLARLADAKSRRNIIAASIALWSLFTAACSITRNYAQLFAARIGVGIGEAGLTPAAVSLIADYFPKERRVMAMSVFQMGVYMGAGIALITAALIIKLASVNEVWQFPIVGRIYPWQMVFFYIGLPGLFIALLVFTIKEPARKALLYHVSLDEQQLIARVSFREFLAYLRQNSATFFHFYGGISLLAMAIFGLSTWAPTFFIRSYDWSALQAGLTFGICIAIFSSLGAVTGGRVSLFLSRRGQRDANMRVPMFAAIGLIPLLIAFPLMQEPVLAVLFLIPICFLGSFQIGTVPTALQEITPNQMRAQAMAVHLFLVNLIGAGLGPLLVALITDYVFHDAQALPYSLVLTMPVALFMSTIVLSSGLKYFRESKQTLELKTKNG